MSFPPSSIRPKRDWITALMDERSTVLDSGIILPIETGVEKVTEGVATVIRVGPGDKAGLLNLTAGQRIMIRSFIKYAERIECDETWPSGAKKEYFFMSVDDVFALVPPGMNIGVFSRPATHAVESVDAEGNVKMAR